MTKKIRDKVKGIGSTYEAITVGQYWNEENAAQIAWLCTTIEKLCDVVDRLNGCLKNDRTAERLAKAEEALKEWEDKI